MLRAFFLSVGQLGDPPVLRVFLKSLLLTLLIFAAIGVGTWWESANLLAAFVGWHASALASGIALIATVLLGWLLFRAVAIAVIGVFADEIVRAVEARHYPQALATARDVPLGRSTMMGIGSAARALGFNLVFAPAYLLLLVTGIGTAALFLVVNGWLLGRDLGDMVAARHLSRSAMRDWRATTRLSRFALGVVVTALFVVPLVNLVAPVLGAAMATHLFHRGRT